MDTADHPSGTQKANKQNGKKLYELARKGITIEVKPRKIVIKNIEITGMALPRIEFKVTCSKGTYIRQLCIDIGTLLGCGAHLSKLKRTRSGSFIISQALSPEEIDKMSMSELEARLIQYEAITA